MVNDYSDDDDALLEELGVDLETKPKSLRSAKEERVISGFEEIIRFIEEHGRAPEHRDDRDIFERIYAVRLERIRQTSSLREICQDIDSMELLSNPSTPLQEDVELDDDSLLAALGVETISEPITKLHHVKPVSEKRAAEEIANRDVCGDFSRFRPLFDRVQKELDDGVRETRPFEGEATIKQGYFFIVGGQKAYVAEVGEIFTQDYGDKDARLRVIFDNGTESNLLMRSMQRALYKDASGRRITEPSAGPLFSETVTEGDTATGVIYVLRSNSQHPYVVENRSFLHKIGVTRGSSVERRIQGAKQEPTFLMADVEVVATYDLYNVDAVKLEHLLHRFFSEAQMDITIHDRFGKPFKPREWFFVPLDVITDVVSKITDGSITEYQYDAVNANLIRREK